MNRSKWRIGAMTGAAAASAIAAAAAFANAITGPSSSQSPYVVRAQPGVVSKAILTVGDRADNGYRMVGIPDGLGAYDNGDGTFTLLMNHELRETGGTVRAHGARGAFVSKWTIDKGSLRVRSGEDLIQRVATWNPGVQTWNAPATGIALSRLCSADLPDQSALLAGGVGTAEKLFFSGEENGTIGRGFAHVVTGPDAGVSYELPGLGRMSFENIVANPATGAATVVAATDDTAGGAITVYRGEKQATGNTVERAGLLGGVAGQVAVTGFAAENADTGIPSGTPFTIAAKGTGFNRPEDAAWDPSDPSKLYFVTTASFTGKSRLWRLDFADPANPAAGGTIDMLLDGTEGQHMLDNLAVDRRGKVLIQEDPGNNPYLAKIHRFNIATGAFDVVAEHDPQRFDPAAANPLLTADEESSGIIDMSGILGTGWYLGDVQAHYAQTDPELVEGGQLFALHVPPGKPGR